MKIPEIPLRPDPQSDDGREVIGFRWNDVAGNRHKLGGDPDWIQAAEQPRCPSCREVNDLPWPDGFNRR